MTVQDALRRHAESQPDDVATWLRLAIERLDRFDEALALTTDVRHWPDATEQLLVGLLRVKIRELEGDGRLVRDLMALFTPHHGRLLERVRKLQEDLADAQAHLARLPNELRGPSSRQGGSNWR